jgi:glycosyltransferase involved in cell wall biosynthesis
VETVLGWKRRVPEGAGGIVCVGEDEYEFWRGRHPHVLWLPNGVDTSIFSGGIPGFRDSGDSRGEDGVFKVLCVARIDRQKGQMALVEALGRRKELAVRLVGPVTQPDYLEEMRARAKALGAEGRLEVVGALPPGSAELVGEYGRADAFVLPSRHEPFGIAVLEAWAAGLPVAASDVGGLGRLLAQYPGAALAFAPGDAAGLDAALNRLETEAAWKASAREAGFAAAKAHDWRVLASRLVDFCAELE